MKKDTTRLIDVLKAVIARGGFDPSCLQLADYGGCRLLSYDPFGEIPLDDKWLLKAITSEEAVFVLNRFLDDDTGCAHDLLCQFSRLLVEQGGLVKRRLTEFYAGKDWTSYSAPHLTLSGLVHLSDGARRICKLLDEVPEDCRDGLFLACWHLNDSVVNKRLCEKFEEWSADPSWSGTATGEGAWLEQFLGKWIAEGMFSCGQLEQLVVWHFKHRHALC